MSSDEEVRVPGGEGHNGEWYGKSMGQNMETAYHRKYIGNMETYGYNMGIYFETYGNYGNIQGEY